MSGNGRDMARQETAIVRGYWMLQWLRTSASCTDEDLRYFPNVVKSNPEDVMRIDSVFITFLFPSPFVFHAFLISAFLFWPVSYTCCPVPYSVLLSQTLPSSVCVCVLSITLQRFKWMVTSSKVLMWYTVIIMGCVVLPENFPWRLHQHQTTPRDNRSPVEVSEPVRAEERLR